MAHITLALKTPTGDTLATHALDTTGAPQHIAAMNGAYYQFTDAASGLAPEGLITKRQGDDLYITFDDGTDLIIDHYFSQGQGALVGQQANGGLRNYPVAALGEHELAAEVAAAPAASAPDTAGKAGLAVLGGLALVGGGIAIAARDHDKDHHDDNVAPQPQPEPQPNPQPGSNPQANHAGKIAISGEMKVGQTLAAQVSDGDGTPDNVQYQWLRDGEPISGETGATYRLSSDDAGHKISVHAEYTDAKGTAEKPTSTALDVENITQTPVANHEGTVSITGGDKVGSTLTANISDADGVPDTGVTYQWLRDGQAIDQANGKTYILTPDDADHQISVQAAYKDKAGHDEDQTSDIRDIPASPSSGPYSEYAVKAAASTVVNVKNPAFGAKGDGKTDDTAAIQKAIDAVAAKGGGIVDIPNGTYLINTLHQESSYFETSGLVMKSNVTLRMTSTTLLKAMPNDSQYAAIVTIKDANNVHLIGGTIEGDRASHTGEYGEWGHGVSITNSTNVTVKNVTAKECWGDGFYVGKRGGSNINNENITFEQVHAEHNRRQGMSITHGKHIKVQHSVFKDTDGTDPRAGIDIEPNKNEQVSDVVVTHNTFIGNRTGFVAMNHLHGGTTSVKNITFEYNKVQDNHVGVSYIGVEGGKIRHNTIYQKHDMPKDYPFHHQYGIELRNGVRPVSGITVDNNSIYGGNIIDRYTKGNTITNNHFKSAVYLHGTAQPGKILTAEVYDGDYGTLRVHKSVQVPSKSVSYRWYADGAEIKGAHESTYKLTEAERGKKVTVKVTFTDAAGHNETATSDSTMPVGYKNHAPTNITLSPRIIYGNEDHAEVGLLKAIDPDYKDRFTYTVSDSRFEINGDMLRLKKGQRIDYNKVNSFNLTVTATDQMGASYKKTFTVYVRAPRGTPTFDYYDLTLSANKLMENKAGATVGRINLRDRSIGKTHTYSVSDKRFEIVNGVLKLKAGYKIDYALEKTIAIAITASNSGGLTFRKTFTLQVQDDPNYPAKVHRAKYVSPEPVIMHSEDKEDGIQKAKTVENDESAHNSGQYQEQRDSHDIDSAESDSYQLTADDAGQHISTNIADTNSAEAREAVDSAHNQVDTNDAPLTLGDEEAPIHISANLKDAAQAELADKSSADILEYLGEHGSDAFTFDAGETLHTLTAAVADEDGVPKDVQYQWLRDGQPISGGTGERYQLTADDAGHKISVQAFYQDKAQHNESPVSAQSEVPKDATPPTGNFHDDFSAYPAGSEYPQGTTFGQWNVVQSGYGHVKIVDNGGGNNALELKPKAQSGQTATSSTEVIGPQHGSEFTFSGTISTPEQLRQNAPPNAWETGWLVWNYTDNDHFYYFVPRANGWELGKRDPAYAGGQRFLATGSEGWPLADSKQFTISKQGGTIEVKINGKVIATVTDDDQPYNGNGRIGIYSEDARVLADDIDLSGKATIEGTANHLGHITLKPNGNTFTAEVHDEDGIAAGTITYQWYSAGQPIAGATGQSYTLKDGDKEVTVRANYTDNSGRGESVLSPVAAGDNHPGSVALDGEAKVGATLTANVSDADGVPDRVQYTWLRDGTLISGAEGKTYTLQAADIGHKITVQAYYKDHAGHEENHVISAPTAPVTDGTTPPVANLTANLTGASAVSEGSTAHYRVELDLSPVGKTTGAAALLQQLKDLAAHKQTLFGQQHAIDESARGDSANDGYGRKSDVAAMSGKYPAVFGFDSDEGPAEHGKTPEENGKALAKAFIEADSLGATVTLSSHLKNPVTGGSAFDTSKVEAQRLISGDLQSKLHDWLDTVATAANNAVRADGSKVPVIFRPLHENTGDWFWWGKGHMSADDYKALWQHIHKYLEDKGVDNLLYAYSPNGSLGGDKAKYLEAYPGDNYVDIFGYDAYQSEPQARQSDAAWRSQTVRDLEMVTKLAGEHGKVAAFTEFGLNNDRVIQPSGNENTQFFSELLGAIKGSDTASQLAYMMTWANWGVDENGKFQSYTPWPGHEMEGDFKKFLDGLTLAKMPEKDVTVDIALQHGTTDDSDAKLSTERVTIAKGQSGADFTVEALADGKKEGDETYTVKITHADGANIGKENLATTIHDGSANSAPLEHHEPQLQHDDGAAAGADRAAHDANHAIAHAQDDNSTASLHIGDGIDPATYAKLVSLDNAELLQYLGEHSRELLAATQHQGAHEQHGGSGDDTLVATHGTTLQEGGAGADTFAYLLDGGDTLHWQGASTITDYNPGEGDRIVLKHGTGWQVESVDFDPATQNLTIKATHGAQTYSNTVHLHAHDGHHFNTEEILNAVTIL